MYNKIVIIYPREFSKKEYIKNSISELKKKIKIEVWILKRILNNNDNINNKVIYANGINVKIINSLSNFEYCLKNENNKTLIDLRINLDFQSYKIFKVFFKFAKDYIIFPGLNINQPKFNLVLFLKLRNILIKFFLYISNIKIKYAKFVYLISKKADINYNLLISKSSNFIKGHHADYDKYISHKIRKRKKKQKNKFFLFIDQDVPNHQDLVSLKLNDINESKYYISLKNFFLQNEKKFGIKYIVSPHPRTKIANIKKYFGNRVSKRKTIELINDSEFILCHDTTAANFAILLKKPIVPIINNELINSNYDHVEEIRCFAERVNLKVINIHKNQITNKILKTNAKSFKKFEKNYINFDNLKQNRVDKILLKIKEIN